MKILYLSASEIPSRAANSIQVMRMCEAIAGQGYETTLVARQFATASNQNVYEYYGVEKNFVLAIFQCRKTKGVSLRLLPRLYALLSRYDRTKTLVYGRDVYGVSLAVRMGFRAIYEVHAAPYNVLIHRLETSLLRHRRLVRLVAISEALRKIYSSRFNIAEKTVVCHDAASVPNDSPDLNVPWPKCRNTLQVGYTGQLFRGKGIEIIVACAKELPQYDFHVIGGMDCDIAFWKSKASSNMYFHGYVEPNLIHAVRGKCDVLLMPYQRDVVDPLIHVDISGCMSPLKLFEYMASRRAIIASDLPVLREVLDEHTAELAAPDKPEEWAAAIRRCEDRRHRDTLAQNAYSLFLKHYTWQKRAETVLKGLTE
jgi:glycosyltransferase involved in cell wall biosynthesis